MPGQPFLGEDIALESAPGQRHLFLTVEQGYPRNLVQIEVETLTPFVNRPGDLSRAKGPPLPASPNCHSYSLPE